MSLTVGRAQLGDVAIVKSSGDQLDVQVDLDAGSGDEMKAIRQQLVGLAANPDEEVVPVVWSEDSDVDGFYTVRSVTVPSTPVMLDAGFIPDLQVSLQRVAGGYANPTFEVYATNVSRTNAHGVTGTPLLAVPGDGTSLTFDLTGFTYLGTWDSRPTADGVEMFVTSGGDPNGKAYRFDVEPADFYKGCCSIELEYGGSWYPVVGRQIPHATRFRISNQIVRFTSGDASNEATFEVWDGASWVSQEVSFYDNALGGTVHRMGRHSPGMVGWTATARDIPVTVLRNSPEHVTIRQSTFSDSLTFTLKRGDTHMAIHWTVPTSGWQGSQRYGLALTTAAGGTARTGGVQGPFVGGSGAGASLLFITAEANTGYVDTANTRVRQNPFVYSATMFIGGIVGAAPTTFNTYNQVTMQMMAGLTWRQQVVPR